MTEQSAWVKNLSRFETIDALRRSDFYSINGSRMLSYLQKPHLYVNDAAAPRLNSFLRVVQWNIEKGKRFDSILDLFRNNDILKYADVIILNEADIGMIRSQNRHVALELAGLLGFHMVFGPAHFELTKGTEEELAIEGENRESLQGNAVLSRYPVTEAVVIPLPVTFEFYEFEEKRFGRRCCLWVKLQLRQSPIWIGAVHLELRNTPRCRAIQARHIVDNLPGQTRETYLLGGDLNTNSFRRGTVWRAMLSIFRILFHPAAKVKEQLLHPEKRLEPLFPVLKEKGFFWNTLNSNQETARTDIETLEESGMLPEFLMRAVKKRLKPYNGYLCFKLDWFLGKNLRALSRGQKKDAGTGINSMEAGNLNAKNYGPDRTSDHVPIYVDLDLR